MLDEREIAALYERHGHALYRRCITLVRSEDDARELVQETFCQFWKNRSRFQGRSSVFTYLYRIATNLSIDKLRRRTTAGVSVQLDEGRDAPSSSSERKTMAAQQLAVICSGMGDELLSVAVMAHVDGLTQEEIAEALSVSRRTVGKRLKQFLARAQKKARAMGLEVPEIK